MPQPTINALAEDLLVRWATENPALADAPTAPSAMVQEEDSGPDTVCERVVDVSQYDSWHAMPFQLRCCIQPFCVHPHLLHVADVLVAHSQDPKAPGCVLFSAHCIQPDCAHLPRRSVLCSSQKFNANFALFARFALCNI